LVENPNHIYVGRATPYVEGATKHIFCNPFPVKKFGIDDCLELYNVYFEDILRKQYPKELQELKNKVLGCYCLPNERCHCDILIDYLG
jgi:hypothetical protein